VYLAGASRELDRARFWRLRLVHAGVAVASTWIDNISQVGAANPRDASPDQRRGWTWQCLAEVRHASVLWMLVPAIGAETRGAWSELGYAAAIYTPGRERIICSGDTGQSIFTALGEEHETDEFAFDAVLRVLGIPSARQQALRDVAAKEVQHTHVYGPTGVCRCHLTEASAEELAFGVDGATVISDRSKRAAIETDDEPYAAIDVSGAGGRR
jgi:hypothetical protein